MKKFKDLTFFGKTRRIALYGLAVYGLCTAASFIGFIPGVSVGIAQGISTALGIGGTLAAATTVGSVATNLAGRTVNAIRYIFNINGYKDKVKNNRNNRNNRNKSNEQEEDLKIKNVQKNNKQKQPVVVKKTKKEQPRVVKKETGVESKSGERTYNETSVKLNNGNVMPRVSFGTWGMFDRSDAGYAPTLDAINNGCRNIDTAAAYHTESGVGQAIRDSGVNRSDIYVSTKLNPQEATDYNTTINAVKESLKTMGLKYIDTVYIHAPERYQENGNELVKVENKNNEIYKALLQLQKQGLIKNIGMSNFTVDQMKVAIGDTNVNPQLVQMPLSVGYREPNLMKFCKEHKIQTVAYSPLASGYALKDPKVIELANKYGVTPADICLDYAMQLTGSYCFRSVNSKHIQSGLGVSKILTREDIIELSKVNIDYRAWDYNNGMAPGKDIMNKSNDKGRIK